jgi:glycosyltransferase involved in cell wall biosynthesis
MTTTVETTSATIAASVRLGRHGENLSIVIPTYNCARYLRETLESLKAQGSTIDEAQIEVLDDCSTMDDPQTAVREVWGDRVRFFRHPKNVGPTCNFNACLEHAQRPWIHILHGDDIVMPRAYIEFNKCIEIVPDAIAVFAQSAFIDSNSIWLAITGPLGPEWQGRYEYHPIEWRENPVQFAGVLISQEALRTVGGFDTRFVHAADYNLWWRLAKTGRVGYVNRCIGGYRVFEGNHSSTLRRTGRNLREGVEQTNLAYNDYTGPETSREFWSGWVYRIAKQCHDFIDDPEAFSNNFDVLRALPHGSVPLHRYWRLRMQRFARFLCQMSA